MCSERIQYDLSTKIPLNIENIVKFDISKFELMKNVKEIEPIKLNIDLSNR